MIVCNGKLATPMLHKVDQAVEKITFCVIRKQAGVDSAW
jgi:hypothetical protein